MFVFILQTILLLLIAYILGCILGCLFHQWFGAGKESGSGSAAAGAVTAGAAATAAAVATKPAAAAAPVAKPTPKPAPKPAEPVAFTAAPTPAPKVAAVPPAKPAAKAKPAPKPKAAAKPAAKTASIADLKANKDDLKRIRGIGKQNEARLNAIDIYQFAQVAAWTKKEQQEIGERLAFPGRIEREEWVKQAKVLAQGKETAFSKRVDRGEVETSTGKGNVGDLGKKPSTLKAPRKSRIKDNLTLIDGVGNALEERLNELGIYYFDQIAKWTKANETWIGNEVGFPGRPERENWVSESKILAAGGTTEHAKRVEEGKITTSRKSKPDEK